MSEECTLSQSGSLCWVGTVTTMPEFYCVTAGCFEESGSLSKKLLTLPTSQLFVVFPKEKRVLRHRHNEVSKSLLTIWHPWGVSGSHILRFGDTWGRFEKNSLLPNFARLTLVLPNCDVFTKNNFPKHRNPTVVTPTQGHPSHTPRHHQAPCTSQLCYT